jgi:hypothetical protein
MRWQPFQLALALVALAALAVSSATGALDVTLTYPDVERALQIARDSDAVRARFHARYVFLVKDPSVEQFEVFTEFRRVVAAGEGRQGDWMFLHSPRQAQDAVRQWRGKVTVTSRVRFHPLNTFTAVPGYDVIVDSLRDEATLVPIAASRTPVYSVLGDPSTGTAIVGATIEATFEAASIGQTTRVVRLLLGGKEQARVTVDFARLE